MGKNTQRGRHTTCVTNKTLCTTPPEKAQMRKVAVQTLTVWVYFG